MSSSSQVPSGLSLQDAWSGMKTYMVPSFAAGVAIVPTFYGFVVKSAQQAGEPVPHMRLREALGGGVRAAPTLGVIVGTQMAAQGILEKLFAAKGREKGSDFWSMLCSAIVVGLVSAPILAIFNGQTMGRSMSQSLRELSAKQAGAILARETSFLLALRVSDPISEKLKRIYGNGPVVNCGVPFLSGAIGSFVGHAPDTLLTRLQKGKATHCRQLMLGSPAKAAAVGCFSMIYANVKKLFEV